VTEPIRIEGLEPQHRPSARRRPDREAPVDFEEMLREVEGDLDRLERLAEDARRAASEEGPVDPESFREAVRESAEALRSARRIRSRLLGAYRATRSP
jgi:hypothetical protein